jgi:ATP-dependent DNA ligase
MARLSELPVPLSLATMEAKLVDEVPRDGGWRFEPKWDGFRCLAFRAGDEVALRAKSGKPLDRFFPDVVEMLRALPEERFVVDGELIIEVDGAASFEALQLRLHHAESRVRKLAAAQPASLTLFDCLVDAKGRSLVDAPLRERRAELEALHARLGRQPRIRLSPGTQDRDQACRWLEESGFVLDGVIAKRLDGPYVPGERAMLKIKKIRTADCVVGGFRYGQGTTLVGSLLLGLYGDDGLLHHVGFTATISNAERPELTKALEGLRGGPGFTGDAPGGQSRWSTERTGEWVPVEPRLVVEVRYDQVTGDRFRHGTRLVRSRPDKAPRQCTFEQIRQGAGGQAHAGAAHA